MAEIIRNGELLRSIRAKINAAITPFISRDEFERAQIPSPIALVYVIENGDLYRLMRDQSGDWIDGAGGVWSATVEASATSSQIYDYLVSAQEAASAAAQSRDRAEAAADLAGVLLANVAHLNSRMVQERVNELTLGFNNGVTDTQIFTNAQSTSQGIAFAKVGSQRKIFLLQSVAGSGSWTADERMRIVEFDLSDDGSAITHVSFTPELKFGHQMISARVIDGQIWIYGSIPVGGDYTGANIGKGFARIPYRGADTDQAEMEIVQLMGFAGSGHVLSSYRNAYAYVDDEYVLLSVTDITDDADIAGDVETGDNATIIFRLSDVEAALDPLTIQPIAVWHRPRPSQIQNNYTQGVCIAKDHVWVQCGFYPPLLQHMMQIFTLDGRLVTEFHLDGPRGDYTHEKLRGMSLLGIPTSFEPEGLTTDDQGDVISLCMDIWRTPTSVVSRGSQAFAAYRSSMPVGTPCTNQFWWTPVNLAPSGEWDAATAYTIGGYNRRTKVLHRVKVPSGGERERPLNSGVCLRDSAAALPIGPAGSDVSYPYGESLSFQAFAIAAGQYYEAAAFRFPGSFRLRDIGELADKTKYLQIKHVTYSGGTAWNRGEFRASGGALAEGGGLDLCGVGDPNEYSGALRSGAPTGDQSGTFRVRRTYAECNVPIIAPGIPRCVAATGARIVLTGNPTERELVSFTVPGRSMGPRGYLRMTLQTGQTNDTSSKTLWIRVNGQNIVASTQAFTGSSGTGRPMLWKNTGSESAQVIQGAAAENGLAETSSAPTFTTVNTASDFTVSIHGLLADPSDELSIEAFVIEAVFMP